MNYIVTANRRHQVKRMISFKGQARTVTVDFSPWADDYGTVSAVTAEVKSGTAAISGESLASNVKTLVVTTSDTGGSMIKLSATAGNNIETVYIYVYTKDPDSVEDDYGIVV